MTKQQESIKRIKAEMVLLGYSNEAINYAEREIIKNPNGNFINKLITDMISLKVANMIFDVVEEQTSKV